MIQNVALDTGPLVAFLDRQDQHHSWARDQLKQIKPPLLSCEAVISEACFLLRSLPRAVDQIEDYLREGVIALDFSLKQRIEGAFALIRKYSQVPMSLADACLVCMAEEIRGCRIFTVDTDFKIYRLPSRRIIPVLMPD